MLAAYGSGGWPDPPCASPFPRPGPFCYVGIRHTTHGAWCNVCQPSYLLGDEVVDVRALDVLVLLELHGVMAPLEHKPTPLSTQPVYLHAVAVGGKGRSGKPASTAMMSRPTSSCFARITVAMSSWSAPSGWRVQTTYPCSCST